MSSAARTSPAVWTKLLRVLFRQRGCRERDAGGIDPLVLSERTTIDDDCPQPIVAPLLHSQLDAAIVEEKPIAGLRRADEGFVGREDAVRGPDALAGGDSQRLPGNQGDLSPFERSGANLWSAQVLHHRHGAAGLSGHPADVLIRSRVRLVRTVREVQPEDIDTRQKQIPQDGNRTGRRAEGCDDFGVPHDSLRRGWELEAGGWGAAQGSTTAFVIRMASASASASLMPVSG